MIDFPSQHIVRLVCDRPSLVVSALIGDDGPVETEGGRGGWSATTRARRSPIVEWEAPEAETYPLAMDLRPEVTGDVDAAKRRLERMARMPSENVAPPFVRVEGLVPPAGRVWVVQSIEIVQGERDENGLYTQLDVVVSLLLAENTGDGVLVARRVPAVHVARRGDTIQKLAIKYYGAARFARDLARAQKPIVRDVRKQLQVGRRVRLP